ncbi:MAG TPA: PH domain-containing protein [Candidatus Nitrosocosmicus sp.]|nr:PH domain-containing protein [Candidatus Nitrosocosmicus sp.]
MSNKENSFNTDITDEDELDEIKKIAEMLNPDEKVLVVARQSRFKPGGSQLSPNVVYATDRRIILRDPSMLGLKQDIIDIPYNVITNAKIEKGVLSASVIFNAPGLFNPNIPGRMPWIKRLETDEHGENGVIDAIPKKKAEDLIEVIRNGITQMRSPAYSPAGNSNISQAPQHHGHISHADEIKKLAELKDKGAISEEEFKRLKEKIIGKE